MNYQWHFRPKRRGDDIADPISGEFFADGSLENPSTGLVREALQNAIDAGRNIDRGGAPVRARIGIYRGEHALPADVAAERFAQLRPHLLAEGNGLREAPAEDEPCDYLVVEDFGTTGLTGDIESDDADGDQNNFVDFVRSDGRTRKSEGDRGSWGVGKNVFPRASRINGFIAYTVRYDDGRQLVIGKSILKIRRVGDEQYQPACYLAASWRPDDVPRPYEDDEVINRLRQDFRIVRNGEPGLSLVIPWLDNEVAYEDIFEAVVHQFYYAILAGGLVVTLADGDSECTLTRHNIADRVRSDRPDLAAMIDLAAWSMKVGDEERLQLSAPPADGAQKWSGDLVPAEVRQTITQKLTQRERIAVRVPVYVNPVGGEPQESYFDVYLEHHDGDGQVRPSFFREQLAISGVKRAVGVSRIRPLVVIDDEPLAYLLRAAEPPNHTDWDQKTANFKNRYKGGNHVITFVKQAVKQLMGFVRAGEEEPDPTIAIDFFAVPESDDRPSPPGGKRKKPKEGGESGKDGEPPERKPRRFTVADVDGGFVIRPGEPGTSPPEKLNVAVAYDVFSGSPWKQYEPADFDLERKDRSGIEIATSGAVEYTVTGSNRIQLTLTGPDFEVFVTGFDRNRDLIVRAHEPKETSDADPAAELHEAQEAHA